MFNGGFSVFALAISTIQYRTIVIGAYYEKIIISIYNSQSLVVVFQLRIVISL